jgi:riboflavin biosynthesis pyrimidine reductase
VTRVEVFGPLRVGNIDDLIVVGQIGQSIDGRVATTTGRSHYINGAAGITHLHRLRALVDAVIIGVRTACADDPQLTVRRVCGPNPTRVVLDPHGRLPPNARLLSGDARRIVVTANGNNSTFSDVEVDRERSLLEDAISRFEAEATSKRITTEASHSAPVQPSDIGPTPMTPLSSVRFRLKRAFYRLWRD